MDKRDLGVRYVALIFVVLATVYFMPWRQLAAFLPAAVVKYRIAGPLLALTVAGIFFLPWQMALAMAFSMAGDFMGAYGSFIFQMGFFALAHIMLVTYFIVRLRRQRQCHEGQCCRRLIFPAVAAALCASLAAFALTCIIPHAPAGVIRTGCAIYALLICTMFGCAILQRDPLFAIGAALFLFSDMILSWNKFVTPVDGSKWLIMVPYYGGQLLLWLGAWKNSRRTAV